MTRIRAFRKDDIPAVIALRAESFRRSEQGETGALPSYIAEVFFGNPWYDEELPSLVAENADGRLVGFLGIVPRRMTLGDRPLRVATTTQLMVARTAAPPVASQLLRALFDGPQDFALADVASLPARRLWESLGGVTATTLSLSWIRLLRPFRHLVSRAAGDGRLARAAAALTTPIDAAATRLIAACARPLTPASGARRPLSDGDVADCLATSLDGGTVRGCHDRTSVTWLLEMMRRRRSYGPLTTSRVVDVRGALLGWYVCHAPAGGCARVVHVGARPHAAGIVLHHLFEDAWRRRCTAVTGRFDTRLVDALAAHRAFVYWPDTWVLVHARDRERRAAVARDDAALTRLDGEWWMGF
jgi:hypothetical protein